MKQLDIASLWETILPQAKYMVFWGEGPHNGEKFSIRGWDEKELRVVGVFSHGVTISLQNVSAVWQTGKGLYEVYIPACGVLKIYTDES